MNMFATVAAAPALIAATPATAKSGVERSEWDAALRAFIEADEVMNAYDRDHLTPVSEAWSATRKKWPMHYDFDADPEAKSERERADAIYHPVQDRFDELVDVQGDACEALLLTPAPTIVELAKKLEILIQHEVYDWTSNELMLAAINTDAQRLAGEAESWRP